MLNPSSDPTATIKAPPEGESTLYETIDRIVHAGVARSTLGLAPSVLGEAWMDWAIHLAISPGKQLNLMESALRGNMAIWHTALGIGANDDAEDRRFADDAWQVLPFNVWSQAHRQTWQWWQDAMSQVHGVSPEHENLMAFVTSLVVDTTAPSNFPATNPEVMSATVSEKGQNLVRGAQHLLEDLRRMGESAKTATPPPPEVGHTLAVTPGKVIFRNALIELIQYTPTTGSVRPEPILIVPAWIMKYYILDLSPGNSFVRFLVGQGYSVFMLSWTNPGADKRDLGMDDYRRLGIMDAVDAIQAITQASRLHAVGYCLGGSLLAIAAAAMSRDGDDRLASVSLLAAQVDFTEAGELRLFISDSQVTLIEDMMADKGYLSSDQMADTFALLHARDLIWTPAVKHYLLGQHRHSFDLMIWNSDATRMPARMHSEYLRRLFLNNDLAEGHYHVGDKAISISDIRAPIFAVGTEDDHVAPWHSVYKLHLFVDVDMTFVLTSGGHNAGIVSEPGHQHRHFRIADTAANAAFRDPDEWLADVAPQDGSWWPAFASWLDGHSGAPVSPPPMGASTGRYIALCDAPGSYVLQT
ncbi:MAG: PHA/PHB synthase family protein [Cobetia marina]